MKLELIKSFVAVAISALLGYALYSWCDNENGVLLSVGGGLVFAITLIYALGIKVEGVRSMVNSKITSWIFFAIFLILNVVFAKIDFKVSTFIIINGIILLVFILIVYSLLKVSKEQ